MDERRLPARSEAAGSAAASRAGAGCAKKESDSSQSLAELLEETRILLPGMEVFLALLATMPFSPRFAMLDGPRRLAYLATFLSTLTALALFVVPAAYHRIARPIHHKQRFKVFANRFLVAGLVPMSISMVLTTYLVSYVVIGTGALFLAGAMSAVILVVWWFLPLRRMHARAMSGGA